MLWAVIFAGVEAQGDLVWERELWAGVITTAFLAGSAAGAAVRWIVPSSRSSTA